VRFAHLTPPRGPRSAWVRCFARIRSSPGDGVVRTEILRYHPAPPRAVRSDPFAAAKIPRQAVILRVKQVCSTDLAAAHVLCAARFDSGAHFRADRRYGRPLRSCAATIDELEGKPRAAQGSAGELRRDLGEPAGNDVLARISEAREDHLLDATAADQTLLCLIDLAARLRSAWTPSAEMLINPFDLRGPEFLLFYLLLTVCVMVAVVLTRRFRKLASPRGSIFPIPIRSRFCGRRA